VAGSLRASGKGSTCRWKAPRIGEAARVDARAVEAVLAFRGGLATGGSGARQGASEAGSPDLFAAENAVAEKRRSCSKGAGLVTSSINEWRDAGDSSEAGGAPSSAFYLGLDCRKVVRRRRPDGIGANALSALRRWSSRRELRAQESSDLRVLVS